MMLYGSASRLGVNLLQDAFRRMGLAADQASVELVRAMLASLPAHHYFHWYSSSAPDLTSNAGLVDTLLHAQDRAYSVPQLLQLVTRCGLQFQCWEENYFYFPEGNIRPGTPLWQSIKAIPEREQWAVLENFLFAIGRHSFIACRPERGHHKINFSCPGWLDYIPKQVPGLHVVEWSRSDPTHPVAVAADNLSFQWIMQSRLYFRVAMGDGRLRKSSKIGTSSSSLARRVANSADHSSNGCGSWGIFGC